MNASNPSSTRSPERWAADIRPSRGRSALVVLLALGGVRALWLCEWPAWAFVVGSLTVLALAAADLARHARPIRLSLDSDDIWHIVSPGGQTFAGHLRPAGHRDATSVVLVLVGTGTDRRFEIRRLCIPVDSVSPSEYSFLQFQLAFAHDTDEQVSDVTGMATTTTSEMTGVTLAPAVATGVGTTRR